MERVRIRAPLFSRRVPVWAAGGGTAASRPLRAIGSVSVSSHTTSSAAGDEHVGVQVREPQVDVARCGVRASMPSNLALRRRGLRMSTEVRSAGSATVGPRRSFDP
jgi:hypothetical protein